MTFRSEANAQKPRVDDQSSRIGENERKAREKGRIKKLAIIPSIYNPLGSVYILFYKE